jgi:hypothetical protein
MFFSKPIQWYHSHADPIWPDGTFKVIDEQELYLLIHLSDIEYTTRLRVQRARVRDKLREPTISGEPH